MKIVKFANGKYGILSREDASGNHWFLSRLGIDYRDTQDIIEFCMFLTEWGARRTMKKYETRTKQSKSLVFPYNLLY